MIALVWRLPGAGLAGAALRSVEGDEAAVRGRTARVVLTLASAALCGTAFGINAGRHEPLFAVLALSCFVVHAVLLASLDLSVRRLPNRVLLSGYVSTGALFAVNAFVTGDTGRLLRAALAAVAALALFGTLYVAAAGQLGGGDVKLAGLLGLVLGWFGWGTVLTGLWAGLVLALAGVLCQRARHRTTADLPLGACLIAGALLVITV
ncbi:prepilin peptidase [Streptantibioticus silvisoli]|uniref:prepilin peptidase n=1 Tax=Streptantibioticus silvisoli TaxID=2705255 RepID=UPI0027E232FB|nr:prepilin peptidase [Streptantibioticus silvisoli]